MKIVTGSITAPKGYKTAGTHAGLKAKSSKKDMALIVSESDAVCAGTYTKNIVKAAPVLWDREITAASGRARAVVINSGVANACTGAEGLANCREEAEYTGKLLGIPAREVLVASTGVIGAQLPMDTIKSGIDKLLPALSSGEKADDDAAHAILTTDTVKKEIAVRCEINGKVVTIGGICKGAGMIHPNMGTMLAFITTDAAIGHDLLSSYVKDLVVDTFNMVSVDGDTSTNDTCLVMANGMAGNRVLTNDDEAAAPFKEGLRFVMEHLAKAIAADGEGCSRLFEVICRGAASKEDARILAKSVVCSTLTKAAVFGRDANWGRILCAMGYSGVTFDPEKVDITLESEAGSLNIVKAGIATDYSEETATAILSGNPVKAILNVYEGNASATAWGCDLTYEYVKINADYRS